MIRDEINRLHEQRGRILEEARSFLDQITDETPAEKVAELEAEHAKRMDEFDRLGGKIENYQRQLDAETSHRSRREEIVDDERRAGRDTTHDQVADGEHRAVADIFRDAMRFGMSGLPTEERQALIDLRTSLTPEMRAQSAGTDSEGGFTVPEGFFPQISLTQAIWGPMLDPAFANVIDTDTGNDLPFPTSDDTSNVGALLAENAQVAEQDVTFGATTLQAYMYTSKLVRVSLQLLQDSAFSMDTLLDTLFGERLARGINAHLTTGTGSSQPNGVVTAASAGVTAASNSAITFDELINLQHTVDPAYRASQRAGWMFTDQTLRDIRKLKDGDSNYIWQMGDVKTGAPATLLDAPYRVNPDMAEIGTLAVSVLYGDFGQYVVRRVRGSQMMRLNERYADYLQAGFLAFQRVDGDILQSSAIKKLTHPT